MAISLDDKIQAWLASRGKRGDNLIDYALIDRGDGAGPQIMSWDEAKLGPQPTNADISSIIAQANAIAAARDQKIIYLQTLRHLDGIAQSYGYDSLLAACSYTWSSVDLWARQGAAFIEWRDETWQAVFAGHAIPEPKIPEQ